LFEIFLFLFFVKIQIYSEENVNNMKGNIKWYNSRKGYGFIQGEDGKEVFVHRTAIQMGTSLNEGDAIEFEIETSDRGPKAKNVKKV
jgi:CspA family cold shock protein